VTTQAIPADLSDTGQAVRLPAANSATWPLIAIGVLLAMQLSMVFTRAVNWDEFWFYYHVADFARGNLEQPLQSLHVRLFAWLPALPGSGVDKIVMARLVMLGCEVATLAAIYALARRFVERPVAVLAALLYLSAGFVMQHGFSFRTDPMATAALMGALAILARCRLSLVPLAAFALLVAVAGMITMKVALYAPAFIGIAWMRWSEDRFAIAAASRLVGAAIATVAVFALLYLWHSTALTEATEGTAMAASASRWMFFIGVPPYWQMAVKAALTAPILTLLALATPFAIWRSSLTPPTKWGLTGLWLPITLPLFYTNTAAYFYVFMLAPVAVSVVIALKVALERYSLALVTAVLAIMATGVFLIEDRDTIQRQRALVETAAALVPEGTAYFDHNGMLPSLSKANYLMTPAALDAYRVAGLPGYRMAMEAQPLPMLVANDESIEALLSGDTDLLLPEDNAALRENYLPFWGPIHLAGRAIPAGSEVTGEWLVPGPYTVLDGPAVIDGQSYAEGSIVTLTRGTHTVAAADDAIRLQWGENLSPPTQAWDDGDLYVGF